MERYTINMTELPFFYEGMTYEDYEMIEQALADREDDIITAIMSGEVEVKPKNERTREYVFGLLGID